MTSNTCSTVTQPETLPEHLRIENQTIILEISAQIQIKITKVISVFISPVWVTLICVFTPKVCVPEQLPN